jgi:F-type H+-transporting ATPase subunit b
MALQVFALTQSGGPIGEVAQRFGVDWPHLLAQIVSFGIVCAVLYALAYRPILRMLTARRDQIAQGLANAEKIRIELARIEVERRAVLAKADADGRQLVEEARAAAARVQAEETRRAAAAAEQILLNAKAAAEREHARMLLELKREIGRLVIRTSAAVTGKILTADDQRRLAEETARQLTS